MPLPDRRHWIFDLDGTLTVAAHDFDAFKAEHGLPAERNILEGLALLEASRAAAITEHLRAWELAIARAAQPQPGARELLERLLRRGCRVAILTRNTREHARETLAACGLDAFFEEEAIVGREQAAPKPAPDGVIHLLARWGAPPGDAVMVGDYLYDLLAGRGAGVRTVLFDPQGAFEWREHADDCVRELLGLLDERERRAPR